MAIGNYIAASAVNPARSSRTAPSSRSRPPSVCSALAALIAMIIFVKYPLNDEKFSQIRDETEARKLAAIKVYDEDPQAPVTTAHIV
jgi:glucuronide carrier protein